MNLFMNLLHILVSFFHEKYLSIYLRIHSSTFQLACHNNLHNQCYTPVIIIAIINSTSRTRWPFRSSTIFIQTSLSSPEIDPDKCQSLYDFCHVVVILVVVVTSGHMPKQSMYFVSSCLEKLHSSQKLRVLSPLFCLSLHQDNAMPLIRSSQPKVQLQHPFKVKPIQKSFHLLFPFGQFL